VFSNIVNGHNFTKAVNILCQPVRNTFRSISKAELFDFCPATIATPDFSVLDIQPYLGTGHVQVANITSIVLRVNTSSKRAALVADRPIMRIWSQFNHCSAGIFAMNILVNNFCLHKWEIPYYTKVWALCDSFRFTSSF